MATKANVTNDNPLLDELEKPETQELLLSLLEKLPAIEKNLDSATNLFEFGKAVLEDEQTVDRYEGIARTYNLNEETIQSLIGLLERLPQLLQLVEQLHNIVEFAKDILGDEQTIQYATDNIASYLEPLNEKKEQGQALWEEIQQQAEAQRKPIKLLTIMKWLQDPTVQTGLKYVQATLQVLNESKK